MTKPVTYHLGKFPPSELDWSRLIPLLGPASAALARYDVLLMAIPNAAVLLSPMTTQEAVLSSRIEGTQATIGEVLEYEAVGEDDAFSPEKQADIRALDFVFGTPIFNASNFIESSKIPAPTARRILGVLSKTGLLKTVREGSGRRPAVFACAELLRITEGRPVL